MTSELANIDGDLPHRLSTVDDAQDVVRARKFGDFGDGHSQSSRGPTLAEHGNAYHRREIVPKILSGDLCIAIGYSEPGAGSDLAALRTSAVPDGDGWIINGQKMWTSLAHISEYVWIAVRTDPDPAKRHKGISMFLIPTTDPGWSCTPVHALGGVRTNATYYDNVRVTRQNLVGELNGGWKLITGQLNRERLSMMNYGPTAVLLNNMTQWASHTRLAGGGCTGRPALAATAPVAAYPALFSTTGGTQGPIAAGDEFFIDGQTVGIVSSTIGSDSFNLTGAWGGPTLTAVEAVVNRDRTSVYGWPIPEQGSRMPFAILKESLRQIDAQVAAGGGGGGTPPTSFTPLTGQNGWNNVAGRMAAGYSYHSATASVELRGYLARTGTATPGEEIVNALPFGRRPSARFDVLGNQGEPYSIETDGTIRFRGLGGITAPGDISLNGVIFRIA